MLILPTFYYYDHFIEMLGLVGQHYQAVLGDDHRQFIALFSNLSKPAQCLYIRMANRKGAIFHCDALQYQEIGDIDAILGKLRKHDFIASLTADDYETLLASFKKDQLVTLARQAEIKDFRAAWPKAKLVAAVFEHLAFDELQKFIDLDAYVMQGQKQIIDFMLYLYFGTAQSDLKSFALRDLGIIGVNDATSFRARFIDAEEARAGFFYSQVLGTLDLSASSRYHRAAADLAAFTATPTEYSAALRAKAVFKVGQFFEKDKQPIRAMEIYKLSSSADCNERLVRLLYAHDQKEQAKTLLETMIDDPCSDDESIFAVDFYSRKFNRQRVSACTELLRNSGQIMIDEIHRNQPEAGAAGYFRRHEWTAYRTENFFWHSVFGLLFWDELYGVEALHSPFDSMPHCLKDKTFSTVFASEIAGKLDHIRAGRALPMVLKTIAAQWDRPNGFFNWQTLDIDAIRDFLTQADPQAIAAILEDMGRDFYALRDGFPDLMLSKDGQIKFVETKAEGDSVRRNQLTRLKQLQRAGFAAEICRVQYRYDPDQTYVVVDVETTGGRSDSEKITEIGAVKMRNQQVIDEWHSLLDPQRPIPPFITRITGITDDMVYGAPVFSDIANDLRGFMNDAVFVAHNVNFDYSFISSEYRRLEQDFKYPKLCTCVEMRRHYPGHHSYSLASLCDTYNISLDTHHRALCDARAAGGLLSLINQRRREAA